MLNKNQSKKRNSWKYALVLPVLVAFMLYFQVKVVAQEKNSINKIEVFEASQVVICKNSSDDYIKESCERIKKMHNIDLKFFKIQRNSKGEIFSIEGTFDDNKGTNGDYRQSRDTTIDALKFIFKKGQNSNDEMGFRNADEEDTIENEDFVSDIDAPELPTPLTPPTFPNGPMPAAPAPDMSKMPTPPTPPLNMNDKKAMKKFDKEMAKYEKKMESFEPDMKDYEAQIGKEMAKREVVFEKEMKKYEEAMEAQREAIESRKEAIETRKETMKEREKALREAKKAREEAEKEKD